MSCNGPVTTTRPPFRFHHPRLEALEPRLPPGDAMLGLLFGLPELERDLRCNEVFRAEDALSLKLDTDPIVVPAFESVHSQSSSRVRKTMRTEEPAAASLPSHGLTGPAIVTSRVISATTTVWQPPALAAMPHARTSAPRALSSSGTLPPTATNPPSIAALTPGKQEVDTEEAHDAKAYGNLPLAIEENHGQSDARVDFIARAGGYTAFVTPTSAVFSIHGSEVRGRHSPGFAMHMDIIGANPKATAFGSEPLPGTVNYFIGNDPSKWQTGVATFGRVEYTDVYPGIDLVYYGSGQSLEYDFVVAPGADPNVIQLDFRGADDAQIDARGDLLLHTAAGDFVQKKPYLYQEVNGIRQEVAGRFELNAEDSALISFEVGAYDPTRPLVIDPLVLGYSTYLGGQGGLEDGSGIAVDAAGNAYVTGWTSSTQFPATPGAFDTNYSGKQDAYVAKLNASGSALVYATYLGGGQGIEGGLGIAIDDSGSAYVTGYTFSSDFPTTPGAYDTTYNTADAFLTKLNASGSALVYSTYLGGSGYETGFGIAVDGGGNAYVCGDIGPSYTDVFVTKLNSNGSSQIYSAVIHGDNFDNCKAIAIDGSGHAYITGSTTSDDFPTTPGAYDTTSGFAFVTKLNLDGSSLVYSTFLGGAHRATGVALDSAGNAHISGYTYADTVRVTPGAFDTTYNGAVDAYVLKLNATGSDVRYATYLGGTDDDFANGIALGGGELVYVTGYTRSFNLPTTADAFDLTSNGGEDAFLSKFNVSGAELVYSTYLGGSSSGLIGGDYGSAIAVDANGNAYIVGQTYGSDFPTTSGALKRRNRFGVSDAFVTKFAEV